MIVTIRTFPHIQGDKVKTTTMECLRKSDVFVRDMPYMVVVNGKQVRTWDDLLEECGRETADSVEVMRFMPVAGG